MPTTLPLAAATRIKAENAEKKNEEDKKDDGNKKARPASAGEKEEDATATTSGGIPAAIRSEAAYDKSLFTAPGGFIGKVRLFLWLTRVFVLRGYVLHTLFVSFFLLVVCSQVRKDGAGAWRQAV